MHTKPSGILALLMVCAFLPAASGEEPKVKGSADWPQFMGPARTGVVEGGPKLLQTWPKEGPKLIWTSDALPEAPLCGMGVPIVQDGKVYTYAHTHIPLDGIKPFNKELLEAAGASKSFVPAELEWMTSMQDQEVKTHKEFMNLFHEKIGSKPMYHSGRAAVANAHAAKVYKDQKYGDILICLNAATGKELWRQSCPGALVENAYEIGCSGTPAAADGKVFLRGSGGLHCLDANKGTVLWTVKGPGGHGSPVVANGVVYCYVLGDIPTSGRAPPAILAAFDAQTGRELWRQPKASNGFQTPALWTHAGATYVLGVGGETSTLYGLESATGKVLWEIKSAGGVNMKGSPVISGDTVVLRGKSLSAYVLAPEKAEKLWSTPGVTDNGGTSPVVYNGHVYSVGTCYGGPLVKVFDLKSGTLTMQQPEPGGCASTPAVADGLLFTLGGATKSPKGTTLIAFKATPNKYEEVGKLSGPPYAYACSTVALVGGRLYVRMTEAMACYDVSETGQ